MCNRVSVIFDAIAAMRRRTRRKIGYQWSPLADEWEKSIAEAIFVFFFFCEFRFIYRVFGRSLDTALPMYEW